MHCAARKTDDQKTIFRIDRQRESLLAGLKRPRLHCARDCVPCADALIPSRRENEGAVSAESDCDRHVGVAFERQQFVAGERVPNFAEMV